MRYLCLIYQDETRLETMPAREVEEIGRAYEAVSADLEREGVYLGGERLRPTSAATTVRVRDGRVATTDGPFAETKEQLGGYVLVEAEGLDQALDVARRLPAARLGSVEVRPIWETP